MNIYVVRHGQTTQNAQGLLLGRANPDLDDVGRKQATAIADRLGTDVRVISSPLARTMQTAAALSDVVEVDERLIEIDYGAWDLRPVNEVPAEVWAAWQADPDYRLEGGESLVEMAHRVGALLDDVLAAAGPGDRDVVLVTHVSPIKAALAWTLGVGIGDVSWRSFVAQASIMTIGTQRGRPSLHGFNATAHLL